ncbi:hypothetical protein E4K10_14790 [Streptomyces sp. T1317-0309]|nr:hypothetical protein E4K10_14790 [Streptomyces sp. T1317-0309]
MSDVPPFDPNESDPFEDIVAAETDRDPDLAVIEAGSRTLRTQGGTPRADVPGRARTPRSTGRCGRSRRNWPPAGARPSSSRPSAVSRH